MMTQEKTEKEELYKETFKFLIDQPGYSDQRLRVVCDVGDWLILYGRDLRTGIGGYGKTPAEALRDFKANWQRLDGEQWIKKHY
jgi:hypothetical protein